MKTKNYTDKLAIADNYLGKFLLTWAELPDINSLHNCNTKKEIIALCEERLNYWEFKATLQK